MFFFFYQFLSTCSSFTQSDWTQGTMKSFLTPSPSNMAKLKFHTQKKSRINNINRRPHRGYWTRTCWNRPDSQFPVDVTIQCLCGYSTKAALKAGQGTRLTKISKSVEKTNNNILQTSDLQVVAVKVWDTLQGSGKSVPSPCCHLLKGQAGSL